MTDTEAITILNSAKGTISTEKAALLGQYDDLEDMDQTVADATSQAAKRAGFITKHLSYVNDRFGG